MSDVGHNNKPTFSSPQNRRSTSTRSQKSLNVPTPRDSSIRGMRGEDGRSGGMDRSLRGQTMSVSLVPTTVIPESLEVGATSDGPPTRGNRSILKNSVDFSRKPVLEVLGALPILLVDDSVSILKMTKRAILNECANISFMEAKNGEEAFELVMKAVDNFELIITDIQMPICNGFDFTRRVRQLEREKGFAPKLIIGISANDQQKIAEEAKASGMVCSHHDISCLIMPVLL